MMTMRKHHQLGGVWKREGEGEKIQFPEELFADFDNAARSLALTERVPATVLLRRVRDLIDACNNALPPLLIFYNACSRGAFAFSRAYVAWSVDKSRNDLTDDSASSGGRVNPRARHIMRAFAADFLALHPELDRTLAAFHAFAVGPIMAMVRERRRTIGRRAVFDAKLRRVRELRISSVQSRRCDMELMSMPRDIEDRLATYSTTYMDRFDPTLLPTLEAMLVQIIARIDDSEYHPALLARVMHSLGSGEDFTDFARAAEEFLSMKLEQVRMAVPQAAGRDEDEDASFADMLCDTGRADWTRQLFFDPGEMELAEYLLARASRHGNVKLTMHKQSDDALEFVGCMLASGRRCRLSIDSSVPALGDWRIESCDGLEKVVSSC